MYNTRNLLLIIATCSLALSFSFIFPLAQSVANTSISEHEVLLVNLGSRFVDNANAMAVDKNENVYLTGSFQGEIEIDSTIYTAHGDSDIFVAKINPAGRIEWFIQAGSHTYEANVISETGKSIQIDKQGNAFVCGIFSGLAQFGDTVVQGKGSSDIFLLKLSPAGKQLWVKTLGNSGCNICTQLVVDEGAIYMAGKSSGTIAPGKPMVQTPLSFLTVFDQHGNMDWILESDGAVMVRNSMVALIDNQIYWGTQQSEQATDEFGTNAILQNKLKLVTTDYNGNALASKTFLLDDQSYLVNFHSTKDQHLFVDFLNNKSVGIQQLIAESTASPNSEILLDDAITKSIAVDLCPNDQNSQSKVIQSFGTDTHLVLENANDLMLYKNCEPITILSDVSPVRLVNPVITTDAFHYLLIKYYGGFNEEANIKNSRSSQNILLIRIKNEKNEIEAIKQLNMGLSASIRIYPNPSKTGLFRLVPEDEVHQQCKHIAVYDQANKLVLDMETETLPEQLDLSDKPAGTYFVVISLREFNILKKVIRH